MAALSDDYPYEVKDVVSEELAEASKHFEGLQDGYIRVGPKGYFFTNGLKADLKNIYNMPLRPDDVFVVTFPKAGTTWAQELVWMVANNFDYEKANSVPLAERFSYLEVSMFFTSEKGQKEQIERFNDDEEKIKFFEFLSTPGSVVAAGLPSPRFIKSHLPLSLLPPALLDSAKVVYVARDPRDVAVSFYHHNKLFNFMGYTGDCKHFWDYFRKDMLDYTPFFPHIKEAWEKRNHRNLLFLFYEDMLKDLPSTVRRVADFFGKSVTNEQVTRLCDHLSFHNFKKNPMVNFDLFKKLGWLSEGREFVRKGKAGDWRDHFDEEMAAQAQQWIDDNMRGTDLKFPTINN